MKSLCVWRSDADSEVLNEGAVRVAVGCTRASCKPVTVVRVFDQYLTSN